MDEKEITYTWPTSKLLSPNEPGFSLDGLCWLNYCLQRQFVSLFEIHQLTLPSSTLKPSRDREDNFTRPTQKCKLHKSHVVSSAFLCISIPMALWGTLLWLFVPVDASKMVAGGAVELPRLLRWYTAFCPVSAVENRRRRAWSHVSACCFFLPLLLFSQLSLIWSDVKSQIGPSSLPLCT